MSHIILWNKPWSREFIFSPASDRIIKTITIESINSVERCLLWVSVSWRCMSVNWWDKVESTMYLLTQVYLISLYLNQYMNSNDQYPTTLSQNQLDVLFAGCNWKWTYSQWRAILMHSNTGALHMGQDSDISFLGKVLSGGEQREEAVFKGYTMAGATLTAGKAVFG